MAIQSESVSTTNSGLAGDHVISSSHLQDIGEPCVQLEDVDNGETSAISFTSSADKFRILLNELKQAYNMMETVSNQR